MGENREERMSQALEKLMDGVKMIFESGRFDEYIKALSRFPSYSVNNCILIASQDPTASYVCGYKAWQKDFNRTVNKGEKGIMILAPIKGTVNVLQQVFDEDGNKILKDDGSPETEKVEREYLSFRPVYVFDVKQTTGDPLPSLVTILDKSVDDYEKLKSVLMQVSPVPISFELFEGEANGYYSPASKRIVIKSNLPELQTIKTMIHEIAHASLGHGGKFDLWDRQTKEVQAEAVAFWVSEMLGLDTSDYSFGYISGWSKDKEVSELKGSLEVIKRTADDLSQSIELCFKREYQEEKAKEEPAEKVFRKRGR